MALRECAQEQQADLVSVSEFDSEADLAERHLAAVEAAAREARRLGLSERQDSANYQVRPPAMTERQDSAQNLQAMEEEAMVNLTSPSPSGGPLGGPHRGLLLRGAPLVREDSARGMGRPGGSSQPWEPPGAHALPQGVPSPEPGHGTHTPPRTAPLGIPLGTPPRPPTSAPASDSASAPASASASASASPSRIPSGVPSGALPRPRSGAALRAAAAALRRDSASDLAQHAAAAAAEAQALHRLDSASDLQRRRLLSGGAEAQAPVVDAPDSQRSSLEAARRLLGFGSGAETLTGAAAGASRSSSLGGPHELGLGLPPGVPGEGGIAYTAHSSPLPLGTSPGGLSLASIPRQDSALDSLLAARQAVLSTLQSQGSPVGGPLGDFARANSSCDPLQQARELVRSGSHRPGLLATCSLSPPPGLADRGATTPEEPLSRYPSASLQAARRALRGAPPGGMRPSSSGQLPPQERSPLDDGPGGMDRAAYLQRDSPIDTLTEARSLVPAELAARDVVPGLQPATPDPQIAAVGRAGFLSTPSPAPLDLEGDASPSGGAGSPVGGPLGVIRTGNSSILRRPFRTDSALPSPGTVQQYSRQRLELLEDGLLEPNRELAAAGARVSS